MGRVSTFTDDTANLIIERMSDGEAVSKICLPEEMPAPSTVRLWAIRNEGGWFAESYARARELQGEAEADKISEIIDKLAVGTLDANSARVMIDAHKWRAAHLAVRSWGERPQPGESSDNPLHLKVEDVRDELCAALSRRPNQTLAGS